MKSIKFIIVLLILVVLIGCGTYTISTSSLVDQLEKSQNVKEIFHWSPIGGSKYPSNQMEYIICTNGDGEQVYLYPDDNTSIKITSKSSNKTFKAYFDTVIYKDGTLYGLRSRILGGKREIDVDDIDKIEIHAEMPKTKKVKDVEKNKEKE